jgi:hypothetical protein
LAFGGWQWNRLRNRKKRVITVFAASHQCRTRYSQSARCIILLNWRIAKGTSCMALEAERIYPSCPTVISVVPTGGLTKAELLAQRQRNAILLNVCIDKQTL